MAPELLRNTLILSVDAIIRQGVCWTRRGANHLLKFRLQELDKAAWKHYYGSALMVVVNIGLVTIGKDAIYDHTEE